MKLFALLLAALTSGCSVTSVITPENSSTTTVASTVSSERTYRNVSEAIRACYPRLSIEGGYFPEAKEGTINLSIRRDTSVRVDLANIQIVTSSEGTTATMRVAHRYDDFHLALPHWAKGTSTACPYGSALS